MDSNNSGGNGCSCCSSHWEEAIYMPDKWALSQKAFDAADLSKNDWYFYFLFVFCKGFSSQDALTEKFSENFKNLAIQTQQR